DALYVYQASARQARLVASLSQKVVTPQREQAWIDALSDSGGALVTRLSLWLALVAVIPLVATHRLAAPDLAMIAFFILASFEAVTPLPSAFRALGETCAAAGRIFEIVD